MCKRRNVRHFIIVLGNRVKSKFLSYITGEQRRDENTKLQQLKHEQDLEELHRKDWHHPNIN